MPVQFVEGLGTESGVDPLATLWQNFHKAKVSELSLCKGNDEIGVSHPCEEAGYFVYFAGGRSEYKAIPDGYNHWELPQGEYVVCTFEAENFETLVMDALYKAERYESHTLKTTMMEVWLKMIRT